MEPLATLQSLPDHELLDRLAELLRQSRRVEASLIAHLGEVDARRLFAVQASSSMFVYCTRILHLSEAEAYLRITVARAAREHPMLLETLADGRLQLSGAALLCPHLTPANRETLLARAAHKSKQQIQVLLAELAPQPDVPATIRRLPEARMQAQLRSDGVAPVLGPIPDDGMAAGPARSSGSTPAPARVANSPAAVVTPSATERYRVQFTASQVLRDKLDRLQALEPHSDLAALIELAVSERLERLEARRFAQTRKPRKHLAQANTKPGSRYIPTPIKRAVYVRDQGSCGFVDPQGRRCNARTHLEFHHLHPHAYGGDRSPGNIALRCRAHNAHLARIDYGQTVQRSRPPRQLGKAQGATPATQRLEDQPSAAEQAE